jgi:hypothetical protein
MQSRDLDIPKFMYIIYVDGGMLRRRMILWGVHSAANRKVSLIFLYNYYNSSRTIRNSYNILIRKRDEKMPHRNIAVNDSTDNIRVNLK